MPSIPNRGHQQTPTKKRTPINQSPWLSLGTRLTKFFPVSTKNNTRANQQPWSTFHRLFLQWTLSVGTFSTRGLFFYSSQTSENNALFNDFSQDFYKAQSMASLVVCFFGSTIIIGFGGFNRFYPLFCLIGLSYFVNDISRLEDEFMAFWGLGLGIHWILDSAMTISFATPNQIGWFVGVFCSLLSIMPMVPVIVQSQVKAITIEDGPWPFRFTVSAGVLLCVSFAFFVPKVIWFQHPKDVVRLDGSRFEEFQVSSSNKGEEDRDDATHEDLQLGVISKNISSDSIKTSPEASPAAETLTPMTTTIATSTTKLKLGSPTKQAPLINKKISRRIINELFWTVKAILHDQLLFLLPLFFAIGYSHQYFYGNQLRMLSSGEQIQALLVDVGIMTAARILTAIWFGSRVLDQSATSHHPLVSQRTSRAFWILFAVSVIGWGLILGQQIYFSTLCKKPYKNCDFFNIVTATKPWTLSAAASILQGAMESLVFCFSLWILGCMAEGSFSMATRYTGLMGWCIMCGYMVGQVVSKLPIGMSSCVGGWKAEGNNPLTYFDDGCAIVGGGQYEGFIACGVWFIGLVWIVIMKRFVQLDRVQLSELKGDEEFKEGDANLEVK